MVGLTSPGNVAFCQSLGVYGRVLTYDQLDQLAADTPCVYVDFAGNGGLRKAIHTRFTQLAYSCSIGGTHVQQLAGGRDLPGPKPVLFFAPAQVKKRSVDWGPAAFGQRLVADLARIGGAGRSGLALLGGTGGTGRRAAWRRGRGSHGRSVGVDGEN